METKELDQTARSARKIISELIEELEGCLDAEGWRADSRGQIRFVVRRILEYSQDLTDLLPDLDWLAYESVF